MLPPDDIRLIGALSTGFQAGLETGRQQFAALSAWEPFTNLCNSRTAQLRYQKIIKPIPAHAAIPKTAYTFGETVLAYTYGLANSSVYSAVRSLELVLGEAFQAKEGKPRPSKLEDLINWFGAQHPREKLLANACQSLRNTIHTDDLLRSRYRSKRCATARR